MLLSFSLSKSRLFPVERRNLSLVIRRILKNFRDTSKKTFLSISPQKFFDVNRLF